MKKNVSPIVAVAVIVVVIVVIGALFLATGRPQPRGPIDVPPGGMKKGEMKQKMMDNMMTKTTLREES